MNVRTIESVPANPYGLTHKRVRVKESKFDGMKSSIAKVSIETMGVCSSKIMYISDQFDSSDD